MLDLLHLARHITGKPVPIVPADPQAGDVAATEADLTRAHQLLGYRPLVKLPDGMARHADWLAELADPLRMPLLPNNLVEVSR
jgi:nucleoside-diphosphate-sugar epimerase